MFVKYTPKHPHIKVVPIVENGSVASESVIFNVGTNEVCDEKWEKIKASLETEIASGIIKPFAVEAKKSGSTAEAKTLKDVPVAVAAKIVAECSNKNTLGKWFRENLSDEIALLVVRRMRQLNMDLDAMSTEAEVLSDSDIIDKSKDEGILSVEKSAEKSEKKDSKSGKKSEKSEKNDDEIPDFDNPEAKM